jgi:HSP20 family protein
MNLVKFRTFRPLVNRDFDFGNTASQIDQLFGNSSGLSGVRRVPPANISETTDSVIIQLAVPGMAKSDFNISLDRNLLTIATVNSSDSENDQISNENQMEYCYRSEFDYSNFTRSFRLGKMLDQDRIDARYDNGLLTVSIQKKTEAIEKPAREISIS